MPGAPQNDAGRTMDPTVCVLNAPNRSYIRITFGSVAKVRVIATRFFIPVAPALRWAVAAAGALAGMLNAMAAAPVLPSRYCMMARTDISLDARRASRIAIFTRLAALTVCARLLAGSMLVHLLRSAASLVPTVLFGDVVARKLPAVQNRRAIDAISRAVVGMVGVLPIAPAL